MKEQNRGSHAGSFRRFEFATSAKAAILWRGGDTGIEEKKERRERDRKRKREGGEEGRKEATEKRLRGDRKYRRVCTLDSHIHNSHFASFSRRAASPSARSKEKREKKEERWKEREKNIARGTTYTLYIRRANACTVSGILDNPTRRRDRRYVLGVGKNVKGTYASRNLTRMTMASASLNLSLRRWSMRISSVNIRLISKDIFEYAPFSFDTRESYKEKKNEKNKLLYRSDVIRGK